MAAESCRWVRGARAATMAPVIHATRKWRLEMRRARPRAQLVRGLRIEASAATSPWGLAASSLAAGSTGAPPGA